MKKYMILAAAAVVAMAACAKVEISDDSPAQKVTFQAAGYSAQTKAGTNVSVFGDFKAFKSRAFLHAEGVDLNADYTLKTDSYQEFFTSAGETISPYNSSNAIITNPTTETNDVAYWAPSHEYYWPKSVHSFVNFVGWYGTDGNNEVNPTVAYAYDATAWTATMTWNYSNATVGAAGANLLYADMAWRYQGNPAANYGLNGLSSGYNKGVPMIFRHALAQINVKAYALAATAESGEPANTALTASENTVTDGNATWTIKLTNVKITPVITSGKLVLTNADPGTNKTQEWTGIWALADGASAGDLALPGGTEVPINQVAKPAATGTDGDVIAKTCVVPQDLNSSVVLSFNLDITTTYTSPAATHHEIIPISIKLNDDLGTPKWELNTKYTYYLQINPSQKRVRFDPVLAVDWTEGTTTEVIK